MDTESSKYVKTITLINYWSLLLFVFWLPLKDDYFPAIMLLWVLTWLLQGKFKTRLNNFPHKYLFWGLSFYIFFMLINIPRVTEYDEALFQIQKKLSFIFFPLILAGSDKKIKEKTNVILTVFILGNLLAALYCLANAFAASWVIENGVGHFKHQVWSGMENFSFWKLVELRYSYFSNTYLSIFKHPAYFSMYIIFSMIMLIYFLRNGLIKKNYQKISIILLLLFFAGIIYLLQSRAAFISLGLVFPLALILELKKRFKKRFVFIGIGLLAITIIIFATNNKIKTNIKESVALLKEPNKSTLKKSDIRFELWYTSMQVIKENFWLGTSPANLTSELVKKYEKLGFQKAANDKLNTHNQYFESFAGLGILGFLLLMFILIYTFVFSIRHRHYLLFFLNVILSINFLFEAMLNRMAGVLFMMFFISLFVFMKSEATKGKSQKEILKEV